MPGKNVGWIAKRVGVLSLAPPEAPQSRAQNSRKDSHACKPCPCLSALPEHLRTRKRAQGQARGPGSVTLHKPT